MCYHDIRVYAAFRTCHNCVMRNIVRFNVTLPPFVWSRVYWVLKGNMPEWQWTLYVQNVPDGTKTYIYILCYSPTLASDRWHPSSSKIRTDLLYIANIIAADVLTTQGTRVSATMILTKLKRDNTVPARKYYFTRSCLEAINVHTTLVMLFEYFFTKYVAIEYMLRITFN